MKKYNKFLLLIMLLIPAVVLAKESYWTEFFGMLFVEAFLTPHMTFFVIKPLAEVLKPEDKSFFGNYFGQELEYYFSLIYLLHLQFVQ